MLFALCVGALAAQPDLVISKLILTRDGTGIFVDKISVTITNVCRNTVAGTTYVLVTFKESDQAQAKSLYFTGEAVKPLKGGESQLRVFDVSQKKIVFGRYVIAETDPYKKVAEANEDNNWRSLFPDGAGPILSQAQCTS